MLVRLLQSSPSLFNVNIILFLLSCFLSLNQACNIPDHDSLLSFSSSLRVSSSYTPLNWSSSIDCCIWEGISCDQQGWVTSLWLPLRGLRGPISPYLGNLSRLSQLNLSHNSLSGSLPSSLFSSSLDHLEVLDLSFNTLSDELPILFNTSSFHPIPLQTIDLSSNLFNGQLEGSSFLELLSQASNLTKLNVSKNGFSGSIPSSICNQSGRDIRVLDFSFNGFAGEIPVGLGGCSKMEVFRAGFNNLSGSLPYDIYEATALQQISLPLNKISGTLNNNRIGSLTNLTILDLSSNELSGKLPYNIGKLVNLEQLLIYLNNLTGTLPLSLMNCTKLKSINLRANSLEGEIYALDFSKFFQLNTLDLGGNNFTGIIPVSIYLCKSLTAVRLSKNQFEGQILPDIIALQSLAFLSLATNKLTNITGAIQILMNCKNLTTIILSTNFVGESIPDDSVTDSNGFQNVRVLGLGNSNLTGQVPTWLANLKKLEVLDLSLNMLFGPIPIWLGTLPCLFYIDLSHNLLSGEFPKELTEIPILVSDRAAAQVDQSYLELPVFLKPTNASSLQYNQLSNLPPAIYLSNNSLSGTIPQEIGRLQSLHVLDLSHNNFSGEIPVQLSNLTNLEKLDLSWNNLSGEIPQSLKLLHFLSWFSVADNNLQGPIPSGGQFDTFSISSFEGNARLCGPVLVQQPCHNKQTGESTHSATANKYPNKKLLVGLILGTCFGVGFFITILALYILSNRRINPGGGDGEKTDLDVLSSNSSVEFPHEVVKDSNLIMLFPGKDNEFKDLTIAEILKSTGNFDQANIIGCGGFGLVYKAALENGTKLAVKKLSGDLGLMEREFKAEVEALSTAQHKNLVSLQGYCVNGGFRLLIYSYMENGSLDYWLHEKTDGGSQLDWPTRLRIAQGASRGLSYMHQICEPRIVHRDIKSSNILLDEFFQAHVADFGLSRLILPYNTHVTTELVGTLGYIPPEYGQAWVATLRGDVYSFGVVMLELLTGKRPVEVFKPKMSRELVGWVQQMRSQGKQDEVFDPLLRSKGHEEEMLQVLDVACMCVNQNPFKRPTIKEVVGWLDNVGAKANVQIPS